MPQPQQAQASTMCSDVHRELGRVLLQTQQVAQQIKRLIATSHLRIEMGQTAPQPVISTQGQTLGGLAAVLTRHVLHDLESGPPADPPPSAKRKNTVSIRISNGRPQAERATIERDLRDMIDRRNRLVHHFFEDHELATSGGCRKALEVIRDLSLRVSRCRGTLSDIATQHQQALQAMHAHLNGAEVTAMLGGRGEMPRATSKLLQDLQAAAQAFMVNGWTSIDSAVAWILERDPDQSPENHSRKSWRQLIHDCGLFEIRHVIVEGKRCAMYRARENSGHTNRAPHA